MGSGLYLINKAMYLDIQEHYGYFNCTIYDKETRYKAFHWDMDMTSFWEPARKGICPNASFTELADYGINVISVETVSDYTLQELNFVQLSPTLDEYPMPDHQLTMVDIACRGYLKGDLLPVSEMLQETCFGKVLQFMR